MATEPYMSSCDVLRQHLTSANYPHDILRITNESLITRARNVCAASFLNDTSFNVMGFIDSDIEFTVDDIACVCQLLDREDVDVAVGIYRSKASHTAPLTAWRDGQLDDVDDFRVPFEVDYAGTGFMFIKRSTFVRLQEAHPEWEYDEGMPLETWHGERAKCFAFFQDPIREWEDGSRYHQSEDYFFCEEVRKLDMKIMADPAISLKHWGQFPY